MLLNVSSESFLFVQSAERFCFWFWAGKCRPAPVPHGERAHAADRQRSGGLRYRESSVHAQRGLAAVAGSRLQPPGIHTHTHLKAGLYFHSYSVGYVVRVIGLAVLTSTSLNTSGSALVCCSCWSDQQVLVGEWHVIPQQRVTSVRRRWAAAVAVYGPSTRCWGSCLFSQSISVVELLPKMCV